MVMLLLYEDREPWAMSVKRQAKEWLTFWANNPNLRQQVRRGWSATKLQLARLKVRSRWKACKGPMGAMILTLRALGWVGIEPDRWEDSGGCEWRFNPDLDGDVSELCDALVDSVRNLLWEQASKHSEGDCLSPDGGDLTMLRKNLSRMYKKDMHQEAGALEGLACGTLWNGDRQRRAGCSTEGLCERCDLRAPDTILHRVYECPCVSQIDHPWIQRTNDLCPRARADLAQGVNSSLWLKGVMPLSWNIVPQPPEWGDPSEWRIKAVDAPAPDLTPTGEVAPSWNRVRARAAFLDGSGTSSDPRVVRVGWGVYLQQGASPPSVPQGSSDPDPAPGWYGGVDGKQSVPAAELAALWWCLRLTVGDLEIFTDNQAVFDGWHGGRLQRPSGAHKRWWERIALAARNRPGVVVLHKCYSHLDVQSHARIRQKVEVSRGNELADAYAQKGAEEAHAWISSQAKHLAKGDALATLVHQRLSAVCAQLAAEAAAQDRPARNPSEGGGEATRRAVALEERSGHRMERVVRRGWSVWECSVCRAGPGRSSLVDWLDNSRCKGDVTLRASSDAGTPVLVPPCAVCDIRTTTKSVHPSHTVAMRHGIVWCWKCAGYGSVVRGGGRLRKLAKPCTEKKTSSGRHILKRLRDGKPPKPGMHWPIPPRSETRGVQGGLTVRNSFLKKSRK